MTSTFGGGAAADDIDMLVEGAAADDIDMFVESAAVDDIDMLVQLQFIALLQPRCCLQEMSQNVIFDVVSLKHCEHFMPSCHAR